MKKTIHWYEKRGKGSYRDPKLNHFVDYLHPRFDDEIPEGTKLIDLRKAWDELVTINRKRFWVSIRKADGCLFSRRNGYVGKVIHGYSVCIRLFNIDIL